MTRAGTDGAHRETPRSARGETERRAAATFDRWYQAHESADLAALAAVLAENVAVRSLFRPAPVRGRERAVEHFKKTLQAFSDLSMPLLGPVGITAMGVVLGEVRFAGHFTGFLTVRDRRYEGERQPFDVSGVVILHTGNDAVTSVRTLFDRDDWLHQIGIPAH